MMKRTFLLAAALVSLAPLTACDQIMPSTSQSDSATTDSSADPQSQPTEAERPALPDRESTQEAAAAIDWTTASAEFAAQPREDGASTFQIASGDGPPAVPVLLPPSTAQTASVEPENRPRFQQLTDGYYAAYPGAEYDIIVNGTNEVIGKAGAADADDEAFLFQSTGSGAMVSFSKYGADYLIEFECKNIAGDAPDCVTEEDAIATARDLIIARTR